MSVCVTGRWVGVDSAWEQEKLEATLREMLENSDESTYPVHAVLCGYDLKIILSELK
jgi:hypothetical protein